MLPEDTTTLTPLLTIAIPTYNRAMHLEILLQSLYCQVNATIEVLVSDNCSNDNTRSVLNRYARKIPGLRWTRQTRNIGFNNNYNFLISEAKGSWCIVIGDDDIAAPSFIERLLQEIRRGDADILLLNIQKYNHKGLVGQPLDLLRPPPNGPVVFMDDAIALTYFNRVNNLSGLFSFISNVAFKLDDLKTVRVPEHIVNTNFPHAWRLLYLMCHGASLRYIADVLIYSIRGNDTKNFNDLIQRAFIDLNGYTTIGNSLFGTKHDVMQAFMRVVFREVTSYVSPCPSIAFLQRILSNASSWNNFIKIVGSHMEIVPQLNVIERIPHFIWFILQPIRPIIAFLARTYYKAMTSRHKYKHSAWLQRPC